LTFFFLRLQTLPIELSLYENRDPDFPSSVDLHEMRENFEDGHLLSLNFSKDGEPFSSSELCLIERALHEHAQSDPNLLRSFTPFDIRTPRSEGYHLWYPTLLENPCEARVSLEELKETPWSRIVTDQFGHSLTVQLEFTDALEPSRFGKFSPAPIEAMLEKFERSLRPSIPGLKMRMGGDSAFQVHFKRMLMRDLSLNLALILLFVVFFRIFYGTWTSGLLFVSTLIVTAIVAYGSMSLLGSPLDVMNNNLFLLTSLAGLEDFLFLSWGISRMKPGDSWTDVFRKLSAPCFFTSLTTILGFGSLGASDVLMVRRFGLWAAWASFVEWAVTLLVLPSLWFWLRGENTWVRPARARTFAFVSKLAALRPPRNALRWSFALFAAGLLGFHFLRYDVSPRNVFPESHPHSKAFRFFQKTHGWEAAVAVVLTGHPDESSLREFEEKFRRHPQVAAIDSDVKVLDWLTREIPEDRAQLVRREYSVAGGADRYRARNGDRRLFVFTKSADLSDLGLFFDDVAAFCGERCKVVGETKVFYDFSMKISQTLVDSFVVSVVLVGFILLALSRRRSVRERIWILFSSLWTPVVMVAVLAVFRVEMNLITSLFAAIMVGLTGDNAIQYLFSSEGKELSAGLDEQSTATVQLALVFCLGSLLFLGSAMIPVRVLGVLFSLGFLATMAGDLWILRGLADRRK
jgi:hypothetical protein